MLIGKGIDIFTVLNYFFSKTIISELSQIRIHMYFIKCDVFRNHKNTCGIIESTGRNQTNLEFVESQIVVPN